MVCYVDDMYKISTGQFGRMKMSHMIADTEEELHLMASKIGVALRWYQNGHYDVCMSMRTKAIKLGAVEVTYRQLGWMIKEQKRSGKLPDLTPQGVLSLG